MQLLDASSKNWSPIFQQWASSWHLALVSVLHASVHVITTVVAIHHDDLGNVPPDHQVTCLRVISITPLKGRALEVWTTGVGAA